MPLTLWRDLTPLDEPLRQPSSQSPHILIIGGGVTGLITAWVLLDRGFHVTILSKEWANSSNRLTSQIAGALWEFPPAVCGSHTDAISLAHSKSWCMTAYHIWDGIASSLESSATGVRMMPSDFFFPDTIESDPAQLFKMREIMASGVRGFRRSPDLIGERRVDPDYGAVDAYELLAPIIDTDVGMNWLTSLVSSKGAKLVTETLTTDLLDLETSLLSRFGASAIVNCTGLDGGSLLAADESVYPIRGGLIRVRNDGVDFPKVEASLTITADAVHDAGEIIFLVPRNEGILLIGGIAEPHETELNLQLDSPIVRRMRERCEAFLPGLKQARLDESYPLAQGLRPFRRQNVRVERELRPRRGAGGEGGGSRIVHSYGQGGAGWSLSFGCAADVSNLVDEVLAGLPARAMGERAAAMMTMAKVFSDGGEEMRKKQEEREQKRSEIRLEEGVAC